MLESNVIEFKEVLNKSVIKEIVAFANTLGGSIYIGISDNGTEIGVEDSKTDQERLSSMIKDSIRPSIINYIDIKIKQIDDKDIIEIDVQRGDGKPYYLRDKGMRPSGVFRRVGNTSVPVSEHDIRSMIVENHGTTYEGTRSLEQELTFLYARQQFELRNLELGVRQMKSLGFYDEDGLYNNLALLLSDQCPHIIKAAIFKGDDKTDFKHRQEFSGSLLKQLDDVYQFLEMQNHVDTSYNGLRRIDHYDYNTVALREGLLNAIVHRDYGVGGSIFVNVYRSSCEFVSLGTLPNGIFIEDIYEGVSKARNEMLANIFYRLELIEAYGTGIIKIVAAYNNSNKEPEIRVTPGAFILRLPSLRKISESASEIGKEAEANKVKEIKARYESSQSNHRSVNVRDKEAVLDDICKYLSEKGNITRSEVESMYGFGQTKSGKLLKELELSHRISKNGKGKNSFYVLV